MIIGKTKNTCRFKFCMVNPPHLPHPSRKSGDAATTPQEKVSRPLCTLNFVGLKSCPPFVPSRHRNDVSVLLMKKMARLCRSLPYHLFHIIFHFLLHPRMYVSYLQLKFSDKLHYAKDARHERFTSIEQG